jgi:energy-coupling factor transporter ATP-binding protein EcfA2
MMAQQGNEHDYPFDGVDFGLMLATAIIPPHWPWAILLAVTTVARRSPRAVRHLLDWAGWEPDSEFATALLPGAKKLLGAPQEAEKEAPRNEPKQSDIQPQPHELSVREWLTIVNDKLDDAPHTLVIGGTGTGKTTLVQAIAATRTGKIVIADPKWKPGKWGGVPCAPIDDDGGFTQIEALLRDILSELRRRIAAMKRGIEDFDPLTVVVDEFVTVKLECPDIAPELLKRLGSIGREVRVRLIALSTSDRVKSLGIEGEGDIKENYTIIRLGKPAIAAQPACKNQERPAALEWRGEHHPITTEGVLRLARVPISKERWWKKAMTQPIHDDLLSSLLAQSNNSKIVLSDAVEQVSDGKIVAETGKLDPEISEGMEIYFQAQESDFTVSEIDFTTVEIAAITALILRGTSKTETVKRMPRYSGRKHKSYADYYDAVKAAIENT